MGEIDKAIATGNEGSMIFKELIKRKKRKQIKPKRNALRDTVHSHPVIFNLNKAYRSK